MFSVGLWDSAHCSTRLPPVPARVALPREDGVQMGHSCTAVALPRWRGEQSVLGSWESVAAMSVTLVVGCGEISLLRKGGQGHVEV